jgi:calcineurin-like phosphoesterase family protein
MIWFTADEHYGHKNIIAYCKRPFKDVSEMDGAIIAKHNEVVKDDDEVWHIGDFTLGDSMAYTNYARRLKGKLHHYIFGSHDKWMESVLGGKDKVPYLRELNIEGIHITLCHYAMRRWPRSHHGSWQLYGHSHGELPPEGRQYDVGVDNNNFYPVSFEKLKKILEIGPIFPNHS